jgi:hypothetical protein
MVRPLSARALLEVWEAGEDRHPLDRALILLSAACPELTWNELAELSVGRRDALLFTLRELTSGPHLNGFVECPQCAERLEFDAAVADLRVAAPSASEEALELDVDGLKLSFRLPDSRDLAAILHCEDPDAARDLLARRCVLQASRDEVPEVIEGLSHEIIGRLARRMAECDPQAEVLLDMCCPACDHRWQPLFDIAAFFWTELAALAKRLLYEVHALALAYGWRESEILEMSGRRRRQYLEMVA